MEILDNSGELFILVVLFNEYGAEKRKNAPDGRCSGMRVFYVLNFRGFTKSTSLRRLHYG